MHSVLLWTTLVICTSFYEVHANATCLTESAALSGRTATKDDITDAILGYTLDQYKSMSTDAEYKSDNIFTSPYSIWSVLAVTFLGARGTSSHDLARILGVAGLEKNSVREQFAALQGSLDQSGGESFNVANLIAFARAAQLKGCLSKDPLLEIASLDFRNDAANSIRRINSWVASITGNKIKKIVDSDIITADTIMVLLNAVYFKASWKYQFAKQETFKDFFIVSPTEIREVDMMSLQTLLPYYKMRKHQASAIELPYEGDKFSMVLVLPDDRNININDVIAKLTVADIKELPSKLRERSATVYVPKTKIESKYNLNKMLSDMGAHGMFSGIDLRGFIRRSPPLKVSDVVHQAFIDIDEKGTEAAAASGAVTSTRGSHNAHVTLKFNRPHIFFIKDNEHDVIIFMGVIRKPQGTSFRASQSTY